MAVTTAYRAAEGLIKISHEQHSPITNLKLQKLLYYAQAWHLVFFSGEPFFDDSIEAWVHGPVIPPIFRQYKEFRWKTITDVSVVLSQEIRTHLDLVWKAYGKFDASQLERLTHSEQPWKEVRGELPIDASSHRIIPFSLMRKYYSSLLNAERNTQ
ncbi:MAG TPA: type II toxin-antitoxin system antitoxin SocA domain-containing protein [Candidatus Sulfotelmatobacter sp.]|jgi:uncharacterized phage-associated protein|nr:type II toxin-antitoxin system antitoxin SocA domain-containing protein [Candidatus Sulfotelmatobacter sp.]